MYRIRARITRFTLLAIFTLAVAAGWWIRSHSKPAAETASRPHTPPKVTVDDSTSTQPTVTQPTVTQPSAATPSPDQQQQRMAMDSAVQQLLTKGEIAQTRSLIAQWQSRGLDPPHSLYLTGLCDWQAGQLDSAESAFEQTLAAEGEHPQALTHLGLVLEQQERISEALLYYQRRFAVEPSNESVRIDLARVLRKLGRSAEAEVVLPAPATTQVSQALALELAERSYAVGRYDASVNWFTTANLQAAHIAETLRTAASAMALSGSYLQSHQLFSRVDDAQNNSRHIGELQRRLQIDPSDTQAQSDLQQFSLRDTSPTLTSSGSLLYDIRCAACHGLSGEADGRAARFLFPRPRNFRTQSLRLVGTLNAQATTGDLIETIRHGMPGTSMPAFDELNDQQLLDLAELILEFRRAGLRQQLASNERNDQIDEAGQQRLKLLVEQRTTPEKALEIPDITASAEALRRGSVAFVQVGCSHCHGEQGTNPIQRWLVDEAGLPSVPRDLARDFMKGGDDAASLYKRIRLGMPGTAHPGLESSPQQIADLVIFCRSLSRSPKQTTTNQQRYHRAVTD